MNNDDVTKSNTGSDDRNSFSAAANLERPKLIDRYRIRGILGAGGFGTVFRATDELLHRDVALKVPSPKVVDSGNLANLVAEAQVVASLDHPYIVPVYNVGSTPEYAFYLVSKLVEGCGKRQHQTQFMLWGLESCSRPGYNILCPCGSSSVVEHHLAKVRVASSNVVSRYKTIRSQLQRQS